MFLTMEQTVYLTDNWSDDGIELILITLNYNMTVWILVGNYISVTIAAGSIRLHMPGVKKPRV